MTAIHGCTVIAGNFAADARVLAESFLAHNPGASFSALVIDDPDREIGPGEPFAVLRPEDICLDREEANRRATMYSVQAFVSSVKPDLLASLLREHREPVVMLDADGCVYADLEPVAERALRHSIVLSPHALEPLPAIEDFAPERTLVTGGGYNGGFLAVSGHDGSDANRFLAWWGERTRRHSVYFRQAGLLYNQGWLTLVPGMFDHHVLRDDRGCNVMGWNLHGRDVEWDGDTPTIDGGPLRYFHFASSFDPERPELLAAHQATGHSWWPTPAERPGLARLCREYAERLLSRGYAEGRRRPPLYATMPNGTPLEPWMREAYRSGLVAAERDGTAEPPNPFSDGAEAFSAWAEERRRDADAAPAVVLLDGVMGDTGRAMIELERLRRDAREGGRTTDRELAAERTARADAERRAARLYEQAARMESSMSWRLTRPLRAAAAAARRARGAG